VGGVSEGNLRVRKRNSSSGKIVRKEVLGDGAERGPIAGGRSCRNGRYSEKDMGRERTPVKTGERLAAGKVRGRNLGTP